MWQKDFGHLNHSFVIPFQEDNYEEALEAENDRPVGI
jgi:hypothetical protein